MINFLDFETKSYAELGGPKGVGSWCYSDHWSTEVICLCWAIDDGEVEEWWPGKHETDEIPESLAQSIERGDDFEALNYAFEYSIWHNVMVKRFGWPDVDIGRWQDVAAVAAYLSMPVALEKLAKALEMGGKDPEGGRLISKYSKLNLKTAKKIIPPEDFRKFVNYCVRDVVLERAISNWLGPLPDTEQAVFEMDKRINLRGLPLDLDGIKVAAAIVKEKSATLNDEFKRLTGVGPRQHAAVKKWCADQGLVLENMQKKYMAKIMRKLGSFMPRHIKHVLNIRSQVYKASADKLGAMARNRGSDGRAHFQCKYHGAGTGRWTGTGFQPLNLSRGYDDVLPEVLVEDIRRGSSSHLDRVYGNAVEAIGKASRHWIHASPGHRLLAGDYSSIEAVGLACLAGEEWKIKLFREGVDIYCRTADKIYKQPAGTIKKYLPGTKTPDPRRQDGKVCELAFGYQGALGAWRNFDDSERHSDEAVTKFKKDWREVHPAIVGFWEMLESASISAMRAGKGVHWAGPIGFEVVDAWLTMILPNGKRLWYFDAALRMMMPAWHVTNPEYDDFKLECFEKRCQCEPRMTVTYRSMKKGRFQRVPTYGGKLAENGTQAVCREILVPAMLRVEAAGYPILMNVYDEILCEVKNGFGSVEEFQALMEEKKGTFYEDWPISVDTPWEGQRYKK